MATPYVYSALPENTIRILELQPGSTDDPVRIHIANEGLRSVAHEDSSFDSEEADVQNSLPDGWRVFRTPEGDLFYFKRRRHQHESSDIQREHPGLDDQYIWPTASRRSSVEVLLDERSHADVPQYEALSYVWGSMDELQHILLKDGDSGNYCDLRVGLNLHAALKHLRLLTHVRRLWIDAISINQEDIVERAREVSRMGSIYKLADRVVVWLGSADHETADVFQMLEFIGSQVEIADGPWRFEARDSVE